MAAPRKPGLGRGLSALLEDGPRAGGDGVRTIPVAAIRPNPAQPRRAFEQGALDELIHSVRERGVLQPILVRPLADGRFEIVAGERRWRAAGAAGLTDIPALVRALDDGATLEVAIVENVQRADLNAVEEADGYRRLIEDYGHTPEAVGKLVGKSRSHVTNMVRLLELPEAVRAHLEGGRLSAGHARALLTAADPGALAAAVVDGGLSVRETEVRASGAKAVVVAGLTAAVKRRAAGPRGRDPDLAGLEDRLHSVLGLRASLAIEGEGGRMELKFQTMEQFDMLMMKLTGSPV